MYLTDFLALNSGPLADIRIRPSFKADGSPKPLVLVGGNGTGKTNILSILADSFYEIASRHFTDVSPPQGNGRAFYRILGAPTVRLGTTFELTAVRFEHNGHAIGCRSNVGPVDSAIASRYLDFYPEMSDNIQESAGKSVFGHVESIEQIFRQGCYTFFPPNRSELPAWMNSLAFQSEPSVTFDVKVQDRLGKPIVSTSQFETLKPWIVDVILDQSVDSGQILPLLTQPDRIAALAAILAQATLNSRTLHNINAIVRAIVRDETARIVRSGRAANERKIMIMRGEDVLVPMLEGLSSGQSTLLAMFGTIARYADIGASSMSNLDMTGIVLIDEIDSHLHSDLQHDVLPYLIAMFPRIQFIVTTHAPLFLLGMEKKFGEDGFVIVEAPSGIRISAERFSEFGRSLDLLQATRAFEQRVREQAIAAARPRVICEGETDPKYLRTAAELLGYEQLASSVDFDWIGQRSAGGAEEGGKANLNSAFKLLRSNPSFIHAPTVLFYDSDAQKPSEDAGQLYIRSMTRNPANELSPGGIENLLPEVALEDRFYSESRKQIGTKLVTTRDIEKVRLCNFLCDEQRAPETFLAFRPSLDLLCGLLGFPIPPAPES